MLHGEDAVKYFKSKVCAVLLLSLSPFLSVSETSAAKERNEKVLYVSLVKKNSVNSFLNRFATETAQLVVTKTPVANAMASKILSAPSDARLVLVELQEENGKALPGEKLRMDNFAVLEMPVAQDIHDLAGIKSFSEEIVDEETQSPINQFAGHKQITQSLNTSTLVIEQAYLEEKLKLFSGATVATLAGKSVTISERGSKKGKDNARAFLKQEYEAIGFTVTSQPFGSFVNPGINFIAEKVGSDPSRVLLLTSHMDSVGNAGADDNGSGTIGALAIANALKGIDLKYSLRIVAFDQEENGLYGSIAYAKAMNNDGTIKQLMGVINLEMTGYDEDDDGAFHVIDCNEGTSAELSSALMRVVNRDPLRLKRVAACTNRSDHASFWKYNAPAVVISQNFFGGDDNPCYHKSCDKVDRVQFDYMTRITTAVGRAVAELVMQPNPG